MHRVAGRTDIGCKRTNNEDAFGINRIGQDVLAVVCDGMGGHHGGEIASELAVNCFLKETVRQLQMKEPVHYAMTGGGNVAHCAIRQRATQDHDLVKMGTTLVAAYVQGYDLYVLNAGDSRCYWRDNRETRQMTRDDSVVQQMMDSGIPAADLANSPFRNMLTNSLNASQELISFAFGHFLVEPGDRILLCSDGLTNAISLPEIDGMMGNRQLTADQCADQLIARSLANKASDNVTVILIEVGGKEVDRLSE